LDSVKTSSHFTEPRPLGVSGGDATEVTSFVDSTPAETEGDPEVVDAGFPSAAGGSTSFAETAAAGGAKKPGDTGEFEGGAGSSTSAGRGGAATSFVESAGTTGTTKPREEGDTDAFEGGACDDVAAGGSGGSGGEASTLGDTGCEGVETTWADDELEDGIDGAKDGIFKVFKLSSEESTFPNFDLCMDAIFSRKRNCLFWNSFSGL